MTGSSERAVKRLAFEPLTTLCVERLLLSSELSQAPPDCPRLQHFRDGVALMNRIEHAGIADMPSGLHSAADYLDEPILAIELDAILSGFLKLLPANSVTYPVLVKEQQTARARVFQAWMRHRQNHRAPYSPESAAGPPLADAGAVEELALSILGDSEKSNQRAVEDSIVLRIARLGEAKGLAALSRSVFQLQAILAGQESIKQNVKWLEINQANPRGMRRYEFNAEGAVEDRRRRDRLIGVTQFALARVYLSLYDLGVTDRPEDAEAIGWLRYASGGDARLILNDLEAVRAGRSAFAV
jgi:hypothetical protein